MLANNYGFVKHFFCDKHFFAPQGFGVRLLAAGAIHPEEGFKYAFESGADFICVGMFDFLVAEDALTVKKTLDGLNRSRPWRA